MAIINEKINLNNKLILLKKTLRKAINKTKVDFIKRLKNFKDPKTDNGKIANKKSAIETKLAAFSELQLSDFKLEYALNTKSLERTITNPLSTTQEKVIAIVLKSPLIQKKINELLAEYDPELVREFVKKIDKKKPMKPTEKKTSKKSPRKMKVKAKVPVEVPWIEEDLEDGADSNNKSTEVQPETTKKEAISKNLETASKEPKKTVSKREERKRKHQQPVQKMVDSFFVTTSGENYLATVAVNSDTEHSEEETKDHSNSTKNKKKFKDTSNSRKFEKPAVRKQVPEKSSEPIKLPEVKKPNGKIETASKPEELHPSWQAKLKQKSIVKEFTGTKIKFDDD